MRAVTKSPGQQTTVLIETDEHGFYAWRPELKGCQSQGLTLEDVMANIKEAAELYIETRCRPMNETCFSAAKS